MTVRSDSPDILKKIVEVKNREVERLKDEAPVAALKERIAERPEPLDFAARLVGRRVKVIAEVKRASPSRGILREDLDVEWLARLYVENGAAAISVLTNRDHFYGAIDEMEAVGKIAHPEGVPVLRKEFIYDAYQVYEARAYGADAILLIATMLRADRLKQLKALAEELGMQCLVEVHDEDDLAMALDADPRIIGINNRDLRTFHTDIQATFDLADRIPAGVVLVSESGLSDPEQIARVREAGASAVLIGDALVTAPDPGKKLRELA